MQFTDIKPGIIGLTTSFGASICCVFPMTILYMDCDIVSPIRMSISIPITVAFAELGRSIHHPKPTIALKRTSLHLPPASSPVRLRLPEFRSA